MATDAAFGTLHIESNTSATPGMVKRFLWHLHDHVVPHSRNNYLPHLLSHRTLTLLSMLLIAAKVASIALVVVSPAESAQSAAITAANVVSLTNQSRTEGGLTALTVNSKLNQAAQAKADALLACQTFAHNLPSECSGGKTTPWDFIKGVGYQYVMAGENLAVNFVEVEDEHQAWMNSTGHRANIMNENFKEIGIGIKIGEFQGGTSTIVVQMFGTPAVQNVALSEKPTPVEQPKTVAAEKTAQPATPVPSEPKRLFSPRAAEAAPIAQAQPEDHSTHNTEHSSLAITDSILSKTDQSIHIKITTDGPVSKVVASYGQEAIQLAPTAENAWEGDLPLSKLAEGNRSVQVQAYDINGTVAGTKIATFAADAQQNYAGSSSKQSGKKINFFGKIVDLDNVTSKFYMLVIAGILSSMILAIAIRKHVQHVHMIANSSFVAIMATLLWYSGM